MSSEGVPVTDAPVTSEEFRRACGRFATGVTIASVLDANGAPHGLTVSSFTSRLARSAADSHLPWPRGHHHRCLPRVSAFRNQCLSGRSGSPLGTLRPQGRGPLRWPRLVPRRKRRPAAARRSGGHRMRAWSSASPAGDHDIFVGEMVQRAVAEGEPLLHFASRYRRAGARLKLHEQSSLLSARSTRTVAPRRHLPAPAHPGIGERRGIALRRQRSHQPRIQQLPGPHHASQTARGGHRSRAEIRRRLGRGPHHFAAPCACTCSSKSASRRSNRWKPAWCSNPDSPPTPARSRRF